MTELSVKRIVDGRRLPHEPFISLILIGLLLMGAILYYRSVKTQRFLEPFLAVLQPGNVFSTNINEIVQEEFKGAEYNGVELYRNLIKVRKDLILSDEYRRPHTDSMKRMGRIFQRVLDDPWLSANIDIIIVAARSPLVANHELSRRFRSEVQEIPERVLEDLFNENPELERKYSAKFTSSAVADHVKPQDLDWIEFHIIPSERLHAEVLMRIEKYTQ